MQTVRRKFVLFVLHCMKCPPDLLPRLAKFALQHKSSRCVDRCIHKAPLLGGGFLWSLVDPIYAATLGVHECVIFILKVPIDR